MNESIERDPLRRGQLLYDLKNSPGWLLIEEILNNIYEMAVAQALDPTVTKTEDILHRRAKANATKEIHINLLACVNDEIDTALQLLQDQQS